MKHGVAFRKFSRTSSHRMLMLRNLVTSLIEHEQIKTTLPKAKDTARLAEKIITMGKKGGLPMYQRANAFLLKGQLTPKVFSTLAERYANREGGYTRIHKYGNRPGDNAPQAILELVDNPRDIKFEMTARAVGWDLVGRRVAQSDPRTVVNEGIQNVETVIQEERRLGFGNYGDLRPKTRWNLQKVLRFRKDSVAAEFTAKAKEHIDTLLAQPVAIKYLKEKHSEESDDDTRPLSANSLKLRAGQTLPGSSRSTMALAQGALGKAHLGRLRWTERRKLGVDRTPLWQDI
ncbi:mitochondrial ribosomal protein L17 [Cristinia sonorae]|uniref:Mitochondrial ribosomal protein L17 n=1 Tax=Cristinia sonorae TaxID=1940300 RepID=A0A8K0UR13_9AGAR|nr:mitochondrial ribosomal protein L17 [Cristinia sonorae]